MARINMHAGNRTWMEMWNWRVREAVPTMSFTSHETVFILQIEIHLLYFKTYVFLPTQRMEACTQKLI